MAEVVITRTVTVVYRQQFDPGEWPTDIVEQMVEHERAIPLWEVIDYIYDPPDDSETTFCSKVEVIE